MVYEKALNIYTDGSSLPAPRRGGMGILLITINADGHEVVEPVEVQGYAGATNNEMELLACIIALEHAADHERIHEFDRVVIFTDSLYVKENVPRALFQWPKRRWLSQEGRPIENATLWKDLVRALKKTPKHVDFEWVRGHSKDVHNKVVDKLAKASAKGYLRRPLKITALRRKVSSQKVHIGCVPMQGQVMAIRVITDTYQRMQKVCKCKYEVLDGEFVGRVDILFWTEVLRAGHHYEVRVNDNTRNPRIIELIREIERT